MPGVERVGDIELDQDLPFEERQRRVRRVFGMILPVIIVAALGGLFGNGPLSHARATSRDGLMSVRYERFARNQSPSRLQLEVAPDAVHDGQFVVGIARDYLDAIRITQIVPAPLAAQVAEHEIRFRFAADPSPGGSPVTFHFDHERFGRLRSTATLHANGRTSPVTFTHIVYP